MDRHPVPDNVRGIRQNASLRGDGDSGNLCPGWQNCGRSRWLVVANAAAGRGFVLDHAGKRQGRTANQGGSKSHSSLLNGSGAGKYAPHIIIAANPAPRKFKFCVRSNRQIERDRPSRLCPFCDVLRFRWIGFPVCHVTVSWRNESAVPLRQSRTRDRDAGRLHCSPWSRSSPGPCLRGACNPGRVR